MDEELSEEDEVLGHREDEDEWGEPVEIEVRPSGKLVLSARIPTELGHLVFAEARRRDTTLSEVVRDALDQYFHPWVGHRQVGTFLGWRVSVIRVEAAYDTANPVVTTEDLPLRVAG